MQIFVRRRSSTVTAVAAAILICGPVPRVSALAADDLVIDDGSDLIHKPPPASLILGLRLFGKAADHLRALDGSDQVVATLVLPGDGKPIGAHLDGGATSVDLSWRRKGESALVYGTVWRAAPESQDGKLMPPAGVTFSASMMLAVDKDNPDPIVLPGTLSLAVRVMNQNDAKKADDHDDSSPSSRRTALPNDSPDEMAPDIDHDSDPADYRERSNWTSDGVHHSVMGPLPATRRFGGSIPSGY